MYQGIVVGNHDWLQTSPPFATKEQAQAWVNAIVERNRTGGHASDWGYVVGPLEKPY